VKYGRKTKASRGLMRYPRLTITLPPELMKAVETERKPNETTSALIARLLKLALKGEKKC
jgi:hypothetical protein